MAGAKHEVPAVKVILRDELFASVANRGVLSTAGNFLDEAEIRQAVQTIWLIIRFILILILWLFPLLTSSGRSRP